MSVATFDTLKFANTLKATGLPDKQAEALATAFADMVQVNFKDLATNEDLDRAIQELRAKIDNAVKEIRTEIKDLHTETQYSEKELREHIDRSTKELRDLIDRSIKDLRAEIERKMVELSHEMHTLHAKNQADIFLVKWMIGATFTAVLAVLGMMIRLTFMPIR